MNIRLVTINGDDCRLAQRPSRDTLLAIHRIIQFLPPLREQSVIGKLRLHSRIYHCHFVIIVDLDPLIIKIDEDKIIALLVKTQTDTDRRDHQRILPCIRFQKFYVLHDFLAAHSNSFLLNTQFTCQRCRISRQCTAASHYKHRADSLTAIQLSDLISHSARHIRDHLRCHFLNLRRTYNL